ncbi:MAG: hypothetical protein IPJ65_30555 [Archangiaceae bacterium]|nr:hypothetical protein [Archangiaceae bacterium]
MTSRAVLALAVLLCGCQSGVSLDTDGGLRFPCTPTSATARSSGNCPGNLFCGADSSCHSPGEQGSYACRADFDCGGGFRCGPKRACVDPSRDALRADAPQVTLDAGRVVVQSLPWETITELAVGRTFYRRSPDGVLTDISGFAVSDGKDVYTVATSQQGFTSGATASHFFVGRAPIANVTDLAVAADLMVAIAGGKVYQYRWAPQPDGGQLTSLDAGAAFANAIGKRLRTGNSGTPFVLEFDDTPDSGVYRVFDSTGEFPPTSPTVLQDPPFSGRPVTIDDMADSDGQYVYAIVNGRLWATLRTQGALTSNTGPQDWQFGHFAIHSPGRDQLITCQGLNQTPDHIVFRRLYVGDNPDLNQVEHPLVGVLLDVERDAGVEQHWMRLDPDPTLFSCTSNNVQRHVARGNCPVCGPNEAFIDMQWGTDVTGTPALRSECRPAGASLSVFYDLTSDPTGFACFRTPRPTTGFRGAGVTVRATSHPSVSGVALNKHVLVRRDGLDDWAPITLDGVPDVAQSYGGQLVALGERTLFRETPGVGLALHQHLDRQTAYPAWISGSWLLYDDGRVGPLSNLDLPPQDARFLAAPSTQGLSPPVLGTQAKGPDGKTYLVMSANDTLLGGEVADQAVGSPRSIDVKAVPEPQVKILSLAVLDPPAADAGVLFQGYVLTENRVFALDVLSEQRWSLSPVEVVDGQWLEVWADHDRGRLGYSDGRVYALPSGVQLAPALDGGATDYQSFCGRAWALNAGGLYRLDAAAAGGTGTWAQQDGVLPAGPQWQKMYGAANGDLWVLAANGTAALVRGSPCTP